MTTKKNSIITSTMQKAREAKKTEENKLTPEQEAFVNGGDSDLIVNKEEQPKIPAKRGRKPSLVKKQKMTFELAEDLVNELNEVVKSMGMTRASFMAQAVMKAVKDAQNN